MEHHPSDFHALIAKLDAIAGKLAEIAHNQHYTVEDPVIACASNSVTMSCATSGASIHYTSDGSMPTAASPVYSQAIAITETKTFKAIAIKLDYHNSNVVSKECEYSA